MDLQQYQSKFEVKKANKNIVLADEIYQYFNKQMSFPRIMTEMKRKGAQFVYDTFLEIKKSGAKNHIALFIWKLNQVKIDLKEQ